MWNTRLKKRLELKNENPSPSTSVIKLRDSLSPAASSTTTVSPSHKTNVTGEMPSLYGIDISAEHHLDMWGIGDDVFVLSPSSTIEIAMKECKQWLADLEEELGLCINGVDGHNEIEEKEGEDVVRNYFQRGPSSPSSMEQVDLHTFSCTKFGDFELNESTLS